MKNNFENKRRLSDYSDEKQGKILQKQSKQIDDEQNLEISSLNKFTKHKILMNQYALYKGINTNKDQIDYKTELDILLENHKFLWESDEQDSEDEEIEQEKNTKHDLTWGERLAKKYYDKLYKEYCICDLSRFKENKVAMRWRIEKEVISGKGQFICGEKKCNVEKDLKTWEVNFAYTEHNIKKNALIKLRLCNECSEKLNYHHSRKLITKDIKQEDEIYEKVDQFLNSLLV